MDRLPTETIHRIFALLDVADVKSLRLACKSFSIIGTEYLCPSIVLELGLDPSHKLRSIVSQPGIAKGVQSVAFYSFPILVSRLAANDCFAQINVGNNGVVHDLIHGAFVNFEYHYLYFLHALPQLPKLRFVNLDMLPYVNHLEPGLLVLHESLPIVTVASQPFKMLLRVLFHSGIKLEGLTTNFLDWGFFDSSPDELESLWKPLTDLKYLRFEFHNRRLVQLIHSDRVVTRCNAILEAGALRNHLAQLAELRTMDINFFFTTITYDIHQMTASWSTGLPLGWVVPHEFTWPYLKTIRLSYVHTERHEMINFLSRHKQTLRVLHLSNVTLLSTSWLILLADIRKELRLTEAHLCGHIWGRYEITEARAGQEQHWPMHQISSALHDQVNEYLSAGEEDVSGMGFTSPEAIFNAIELGFH
ncbi:uncharacterized protein F4812DRAFT_145207 [Daldinia caldariorum]|uniref:uncharacterized protein n=1 Tax=Daldinia caldariorum TaxID=326644 RepID=UPI0020078E8F|nr:uncharacterized protein F4812DRAFT_145207 [Daldinia caldariorum]KAI1464939.1 hypothetical protein F4812DRAFT_145207 [Daldinia caldariorum]